MTHGVENLSVNLNDSWTREGQTPPELSEWMVNLDLAAALLMNFNTVTLMLGMGAATYWKEVTSLFYHERVPSVDFCLSL